MEKISVAIVAKDEGENLARTLRSVVWANEIVLVDSGSTDQTVAIALSYGAKVFHESWKGYGAQVNSALDKCTCAWILNLDADEEVSAALISEIHTVLATEPEFDAYSIPRLNLIFGRWMRHGGLYPDRKLRLFRKGVARLREDTEPHATPKTNEPIGRLRCNILHYQYPTLSLYTEHMSRYAQASVPLMLHRGKTSSTLSAFIWNTLFNPLCTFLYNYMIRGGFLDGRQGLIFHFNHSVYVHLKYVLAWKAADGEQLQTSSSLSRDGKELLGPPPGDSIYFDGPNSSK